MLLIFGLGYVGNYVRELAEARGIEVYGTKSSSQSSNNILQFNENYFDPKIIELLNKAEHILVTIPPVNGEDIVAKFVDQHLTNSNKVKWIGYCSATNVYGDHKGKWVNEKSKLKATETKGLNRIKAENSWSKLSNKFGLNVNIFRLAGIYGPGRSTLTRVMNRQSFLVKGSEHYFSRIHVKDIARIIDISIQKQTKNKIYNLADDEPSSFNSVMAFCCDILCMLYPPYIEIEELSPEMRSYFANNKRVSNKKVKSDLKYEFIFPNYREGLRKTPLFD